MPNTTFIIPIKIDSEIRFKNIQITLKYLLKHTDGLIHLFEADENKNFDCEELHDERVWYRYEYCPTTEFHRTKLINKMLSEVTTPITANYDADVLLPPNAYKVAEKFILEDNVDVVYPYGFEQFDQRKISPLEHNLGTLSKTLDLESINQSHLQIDFCRFGHVQFFNTNVYKDGFMENENYLHWCPEDEERGIRFIKLGYKVIWFSSLIFHQEHPPSKLKPPLNRDDIYDLHSKLIKLEKNELIEYYSNQSYIKKYIKEANVTS